MCDLFPTGRKENLHCDQNQQQFGLEGMRLLALVEISALPLLKMVTTFFLSSV